MRSQFKKYFIRTIKVAIWATSIIVILLLLLSYAIQIPSVQNRIVQKIVGDVQKKLGTNLSLGAITIGFPKTIVIHDLYVEDQHKDTLLYVRSLSVDTDLWGLVRHRIELNRVNIKTFRGYVNRTERDSAFNFDFIIDAFSKKPSSPVKDSTSSWSFALKKISLEHTSLHFYDSLTGNFISGQWVNLEASTDEFDLSKSTIKFDKVLLSDVVAKFTQTKSPSSTQVAEDKTESTPFNFGINNLDLQKIGANYEDRVSGKHIRLDLRTLKMKSNAIDITQQLIDISNLNIEDAFVSYQVETSRRASQDSVRVDHQQSDTFKKPWKIKLDGLSLAGVGIQYYDFTKPVQDKGMDFNHLWVSQLNVQMQDFFSKGSLLQSNIKNISFFEKSGFAVAALKTDLKLTEHDLTLHNLFVATGNSKLHLDGAAKFNSIERIAQEYAHATLQVKIDSSYVAVKDLLYFQPHVLDSLPMHFPAKTKVTLHGLAHGTVNHITVENLYAKTLDHTTLSMQGVVNGLPRVDSMMMNVALNKFYTTDTDMRNLFQDSLLESNVKFPSWLNVKGTYKGSLLMGKIQSLITSSMGNVTMNADVNFDSTSVAQGYSGELKLDSIDAGHLLKKGNALGKVSLTARAAGKGWKMKNLNTAINLHIQSLMYKGYAYRDIQMKGTMKSYFFDGSILSQDKNLDFNVVGNLDYGQDVPRYHLTAELKSMDLHALHLSEQTLKARGTLDLDLATRDFKSINGDLDIRHVAIYNGAALYKVDSLLFASIDQEGETSITIESDLISGNFKGTMNLFDLPLTLRRHFDSYFYLHDTTLVKDVKPQNFTFNLELKKTELLTEIIFPKLTSFNPGIIRGDFNSIGKKLDLTIAVAKIVYDGTRVDSVSIKVSSNKKSLNYKVEINNFKTNMFQIPGLSWNGIVASDSVKTKVEVLDSLAKDRYVLGGVFYSHNKEFQFRFLPGQTMLNYNPWTVPGDNYVLFNEKGLVANDLILTHNTQKIFIKTTSAKDSSLSVGFRQFDVEELVSIISGSKTLVAGTLDGDLHFLRNGGVDASVKLNSLIILKQLWGDMTLKANYERAGKTTVKLIMKGDNGDLNAEGYYLSSAGVKDNQFDMAINISKLNLQILEPLTFGQLKNMKGMMKSDLTFKGSMGQPKLNGTMNFVDAQFTSTYLNTSFALKDETIQFTPAGIQLNNFDILDANKNNARLNGLVGTSTYTAFNFNLDVSAKNFELLNTTEDQNDLFYGKIHINTKAKLTGTSDQPVVVMNLSLTEGSTFTYIVPQSDKGVLEQKGIVEFVDKDAAKDPFLVNLKLADTIQSKFAGVDLTANIELSPKVAFTIIIDPATGDKLAVQGDGTLSLEISPSGDMQLTGRYEISKGTYNLSFYKLVKREFSIEKGSTITWFGDPLNARMEIHAVYNLDTSPLELLSNQLNSANTTELNQYKQRLPFQVFLNINGELLSPEINFQLGMPIEKRNAFGGNVYARIQDINTRESDLNRQVFSLLLLKRFMADNPLDNQGASSMEGNARRSVSRLLTEQLNQLSGNIKGVDLNFDLRSDESYSTGTATGNTKLQVGVSQKLFNDRLVVKVAGNVNIEGETSSQSAFTDYLGDLALEYKVTEDGRLRVTGFRNSNYDMIDGELIQTGVGLIYMKEYNFLRELFRANAKDK